MTLIDNFKLFLIVFPICLILVLFSRYLYNIIKRVNINFKLFKYTRLIGDLCYRTAFHLYNSDNPVINEDDTDYVAFYKFIYKNKVYNITNYIYLDNEDITNWEEFKFDRIKCASIVIDNFQINKDTTIDYVRDNLTESNLLLSLIINFENKNCEIIKGDHKVVKKISNNANRGYKVIFDNVYPSPSKKWRYGV